MKKLNLCQKNLIALRGMIFYELKRILRVWKQTLIPPVMNASLFFLVFGHFIGSKVPEIQGYSYMSFLIPGLIMMAIIMDSYNGSVFPFFMSKFHRDIESIFIAPVWNVTILLGFTLSGMVRGLVIGVLIMGVALLFEPLAPLHWGILLIAAVLASALFSFLGFMNAIFARSFEDVAIVPTFILTPLVYLGGVFYSIQQLSPFWQKIFLLNPLAYIISIFRYGFLGIGGVSSYQGGLAILVMLIVIVFSVNIYLLRKGVRLKN